MKDFKFVLKINTKDIEIAMTEFVTLIILTNVAKSIELNYDNSHVINASIICKPHQVPFQAFAWNTLC